jgi:hypothetical protein
MFELFSDGSCACGILSAGHQLNTRVQWDLYLQYRHLRLNCLFPYPPHQK